MKKLLIAFGAANVLLMTILFSLIVLSELYPLRPGGFLYPVQDRAEQWRLQLSSGDTRRAEVAMNLVERRVVDLAAANEPDRLQPAAMALEAALDQAMARIEQVPAAGQEALYGRFRAILGQAEVVLTDSQEGPALAGLSARVLALQQATVVQQAAVAPRPAPSSLVQPEPIPFLGTDVEHDTYPLMASHEGVECEACHTDGKYVDTARDCEDCHQAPGSLIYADHFQGACEDCHMADGWVPEVFDHAAVADCQSCHLDERPADHYAQPRSTYSFIGQPFQVPSLPFAARLNKADGCIECHTSTTDWQIVSFDHTGFDDCASCHEAKADLDGHYEGDCAQCHTTETWTPLFYDHADAGECAACHQLEIPTDHYWQPQSFVWYAIWKPGALPREVPRPLILQQGPATCSNCHVGTETWQQVAFDHTGTGDCATCHTGSDVPAEHPQGACSDCHGTADWQSLTFDHAAGSCADCHTAAGDHYDADCALCHGIDSWEGTDVDHSRLPDCADCHTQDEPYAHYTGQCSRCHSTATWTGADPDHADLPDCRSCHGAVDHYRGQCSQCHNTVAWSQVWFNHAGFNDCTTCHEGEAPDGHYDKQCSNCHDVSDWSSASMNHAGYSDCGECHEAPAPHYTSSCIECHATTADWTTTIAVHNGLVDCTVCHTAPAEHPEGPCLDCHNTTDWQQTEMSHVGLVDCVACHTPPEGHWPGACSSCHNTTDWTENLFVHVVGSDCAYCHLPPEAHYPGQCSLCHNTVNWYDYSYSHTGAYACLPCHPTPEGHWPGECIGCHTNTEDWADAVFNHTGYTNCVACHSLDRPSSHPRGQCSNCHTTDTWLIATPTPTSDAMTGAVDTVRVRATEEPSTLQVITKQVGTENLVAPTPSVEEQAPVP